MKKMLFISNISKGITNFSLPSILAGQGMGYEFHMAANYSKFTDDASVYNVKLHHIDLSRNPLSFKNIIAYKQMLKLMKQEKYEVIHCNTPIGGILGRVCGRQCRVPKIIYTAHGFHFYKGAPLINRTIFKWVEMWLAHYTDAIITINQEDYNTACKLKNDKAVYYIHGVGVDTSFITQANSKRMELSKEFGINDNSILIISIGELNQNKNNEIIIKALGNLQNDKIHYFICGVGNKRDELYSLCIKNNIEKNVHFLGFRTDVPQLLKSCDIFVMPSYREGLSRAIMEAMVAGLPCVVSKIRGNIDLIDEEKGGFLVSPTDSLGFARAIDKLALDKELREQMGKYNLEKVKRFDVENVKKEMRDIYRDVILK